MAYVTVKGGEQAIDNAHAWLAEERRGDRSVPEVSLAQIEEQLGRAWIARWAKVRCTTGNLPRWR